MGTTTAATAGSHTLTAIAKDAANNSATGTNVGVTVANTPPAARLPVAAYAFNEASGTTVADASGNGHAGTITGAARTTTTGKNGGALSFDGVNDSVSVPDANDLDLTTGMTLEAWVNPTNTPVGDRADQGEARRPVLRAVLRWLDGAGRRSRPAPGRGEAPGPAGTAPAVNTWTHLAGTYDGTTLKLYKNGALISSKAVAGNITVSNGALKIGGNAIWGEWFAGQIDDVRVYNTALTRRRSTSDMNTPVGGAPAPDTTAPSVPGDRDRRVGGDPARARPPTNAGVDHDDVGVDRRAVQARRRPTCGAEDTERALLGHVGHAARRATAPHPTAVAARRRGQHQRPPPA